MGTLWENGTHDSQGMVPRNLERWEDESRGGKAPSSSGDGIRRPAIRRMDEALNPKQPP